jgi:hypothetical protein
MDISFGSTKRSVDITHGADPYQEMCKLTLVVLSLVVIDQC